MLKVANFTMPKKECTRKNRKKPLCRPTLIKYLLIGNCATTTEMLTFFHTSLFFGGRYTVYPTAAIFSFTSKENLIFFYTSLFFGVSYPSAAIFT